MIKIAHLSDPHINLKYHPEHLPRLESVLRDVLDVRGADHVVITGDLSSNADQRDFSALLDLFDKLDILDPKRLTIVPGNHDIYGGPHLAEDVLNFPRRCQSCNYDELLGRFQEAFAPLFRGAYTASQPYPFVKMIRGVAIIGLNSIARYSTYWNPVGSTGEISTQHFADLERMLELPLVQNATSRLVAVHHHLFRRRDAKTLHSYTPPEGIFALIEQETLKLRNKRALIGLLERGKVSAILHGHVHFTGDYMRNSVRCYNGAGAVFPLTLGGGLQYNLLTINEKGTSLDVPSIEPFILADDD
ncbi:MAG TPA: metallophosphoesterase [Candidatus Kapabacteria bacterium]|nr:metallophosphoesterase [Candidatus Kapabacteria bacterium]